MDWLTFFSNAIHDLAWPGLIIGGFFALRVYGAALPEFIEKLRYGDWELTLRKRELAEANSIAEKIENEPVEITISEHLNSPPTEQDLFKARPDLEILDIWNGLEKSIIGITQSAGMMRYTNPTEVMKHLVKSKKLALEDIALYDRLRSIRNRLAHGRSATPMSSGEAADYRRLVNVLLKRLSQVENPLEDFPLEPT